MPPFLNSSIENLTVITSNVIHSIRETASSINSLDEMAESQRHNLAKTLADNLTLEVSEADALIEKYPDDALALYVTFAEKIHKYGEHAREWRHNTMALLPLRYWSRANGENGPSMVSDNPYSSLKYLSHREIDSAKAFQQLTNRHALHEALKESLEQNVQEKYAPLLTWDEKAPENSENKERYPYLKDMALWQLLQVIEEMFDMECALQEKLLRSRLQLHDKDATPAESIGKLSRSAAMSVQGYLAQWNITDFLFWNASDMGVRVLGEVPVEEADIGQRGHLILRVLCNLAANRILLERSRIQGLATIGAKANQELLGALNRNGLFEAPNPETYAYDDEGIRKLLLDWFGPQSALAEDHLLGMSLKGQDLDVVLAQAKNIQNQYIHTRGYLSTEQYRSGYDNFLFALAVMACYFGGIKLPDEFFPGKLKPAFPARNLGVRRIELVGPEAIELLKAMYGQLLYGNPGSQLKAAGIQSYVDNFRLRHAYLQELLFNMFKRLSPSQLLHFDKVMMRIVHKNEKGLEDEDRKATFKADRLTRFKLALKYFYQIPR